MLNRLPDHEAGFTLIELLLAMALFSFGLLVIVTGFLALLGYYQNGTENRIVQTAARNATIFYLDTLTHQIMQAGWNEKKGCDGNTATTSPPLSITSPDAKVFALQPDVVGGFTFYVPGRQIQSCPQNTPCDNLYGNFKAHNMRVTVIVSSQDSSHLLPNGTGCLPSASAFCVVTTLSTDMESVGYNQF